MGNFKSPKGKKTIKMCGWARYQSPRMAELSGFELSSISIVPRHAEALVPRPTSHLKIFPQIRKYKSSKKFSLKKFESSKKISLKKFESRNQLENILGILTKKVFQFQSQSSRMDNFKSPQTFEPLYKSSRVCDFDLKVEKRCNPKVAQKSG